MKELPVLYFRDDVNNYSDAEFRENFRMYRVTFEYILELIENKISKSIIKQGRPTINARTQLLLALWYS